MMKERTRQVFAWVTHGKLMGILQREGGGGSKIGKEQIEYAFCGYARKGAQAYMAS